jgi:hypothetical protein
MNKLQLAHRGLVLVVLAGALAACSGEATAPSGPFEQAAPLAATVPVRGPTRPNPIGIQQPCDNPFSERVCRVIP